MALPPPCARTGHPPCRAGCASPARPKSTAPPPAPRRTTARLRSRSQHADLALCQTQLDGVHLLMTSGSRPTIHSTAPSQASQENSRSTRRATPDAGNTTVEHPRQKADARERHQHRHRDAQPAPPGNRPPHCGRCTPAPATATGTAARRPRPGQTRWSRLAACAPQPAHGRKANGRQPATRTSSSATPGCDRSRSSPSQFGSSGRGPPVPSRTGTRFSVKARTPSCAQGSIMFTAMVWPASWYAASVPISRWR
jgi:hypothetical protein